MEEIQNKALAVDWAQLLELIQTQGVTLAVNVTIAIAIFYIGKLVVCIALRMPRTIMPTTNLPT